MQILFHVAIALGLAVALTHPVSSMAQDFNKVEEPDRQIVASGNCEVPVCVNVDFGDYFFRLYAPARTLVLKFIPKGACKCATVRNGLSGFNGMLRTSVMTSEGKRFPNVSITRVQSDTEKRRNLTSWEHYQQRKAELVDFSGYRWRDDDFSGFNILVHPRIYPFNRRRIYFVPVQQEFRFQDQAQPIIFYTPLGHEMADVEAEKSGPNVAGSVQLTSTVHLTQFFVPRLVPSRGWIATMEHVAASIGERLIRKERIP